MLYYIDSYSDEDNDIIDEHESWLNEVDSERKKCYTAQKKANEKMIKQHAKKYKVTEYNVGDSILLQNPKSKTRRGKKVLDEPPAFEGHILEVKGNNFRVQYETNNGEHLTNWFSVCNIVSLTKDAENKRKKTTQEESIHADKTSNNKSNNNNNKINKNEKPLKKKAPEQSFETLVLRLSEFDLRPEETLGDGNCFFRAISRMVYMDDSHHLEVRRQAIERIADYPEDYAGYFDKTVQPLDDYIYEMCRDGVWADNAVIRATADALHIEIRIVQATDDDKNIHSFTPDEVTQTVFLGYINNHYLSTINLVEPQTLRYGGVTSSGVILDRTDPIDTTLTWFFNFLCYNPEIIPYLEKSIDSHILSLLTNYKIFRTGNSADAKCDWYSKMSSKSIPITTEILKFDDVTDLTAFANPINDTIFGTFKYKKCFKKCSNKECLWKLPSVDAPLNRASIDDIKGFNRNGRERCPSCYGYFHYENKLTVASPFLIIYGEGYDLNNYPSTLNFTLKTQHDSDSVMKYDLSYVGLRTMSTDTPHFTSFFNHKNMFWYHHEGFNSGNPLTKFLSLPSGTTQTITFLVYVCLAAFGSVDF